MRACVVSALVVLLIVYIVVGGIVFHFLEWENEEVVRADTTLIQADILKQFPCVTKEALHQLVSAIITAHENGVLLSQNATSTPNTNWDWYSSIFFATTVVTTIGYGNISPSTIGGQIFSVCFALLGIPLCLLVLGAIGDSLNNLSAAMQNCLKCRCIQSIKIQKILRGIFTVAVGCALFMLIPAIIFSNREGWTYWESFYYCFITLTTIGFGDYVAGVERTLSDTGHGIYRLCISCWILIGLAWMSSFIALYQDEMERVIEKVDLDLPSTRGTSRRGSDDDEKAEMRDFENIAFSLENGIDLTQKGDNNVPSTQL